MASKTATVLLVPSSVQPMHARNAAYETSRRTALCVGIDKYSTAPLYGCVNDALAWANALTRLGFAQPRILLNEQATRDAIVLHLTALVEQSQAGDVLVFQYAGHGTLVPDLDIESEGDTPGEDEALCPYDFAAGELLIDDDIQAILRQLPKGVNLTCFFDCCYAGPITRFASNNRPGNFVQEKRARFIKADANLIKNYIAKKTAISPPDPVEKSMESMREVVFSACLSSEVALESNGHGDFTWCAMQVLAQDIARLSNCEFVERVAHIFGRSSQQHAKLHCSQAAYTTEFLQPFSVF